MDIFGFIGNIFGYLLWFLFLIFKNFGVSIIIFTIILKFIMYPFTLKQQRGMAGQARMTKKQNELKEKYGANKTKYNEELQKLYEKEGFNPASGCLNSIFPMVIMLGIYGAVISPLRNTLHIASTKIDEAVKIVQGILGSTTTAYPELEIVRNWDNYKDQLTMFTQSEIDKIESFSDGFTFAGLDLLKFPSEAQFLEFLWIIPVLSLVSSWALSFYMNKVSNTQQPGCMKATMYIMPLLSAWWAYTFPAAVGFYWIANQVVSAGQYYITNRFFSVNHMAAKGEAERFVTLEMQESKYTVLSASAQKQIADRIEASKQQNEISQNKTKQNSNSKKKNQKSNKSSNDYMGNKK